MKIRFFLAWYDFWIGFYYDSNMNILYFCPLPMFVFVFDFSIKKLKDTHLDMLDRERG